MKVLQGNWGYGWDDLAQYDKYDNGECRADLKAYHENDPSARYRVIFRRVPNEDYQESNRRNRGQVVKESSNNEQFRFSSASDVALNVYGTVDKVCDILGEIDGLTEKDNEYIARAFNLLESARRDLYHICDELENYA